jgi:hypothetical protein
VFADKLSQLKLGFSNLIPVYGRERARGALSQTALIDCNPTAQRFGAVLHGRRLARSRAR